jgi:hypothetical protein
MTHRIAAGIILAITVLAVVAIPAYTLIMMILKVM